MKIKIFAAALLLFALATSSFASNANPIITTRQIAITSSFQKVVVGEYLNVVLVQDDSKTYLSISGDGKSVQYIRAEVINNQLIITAKKNMQGKRIIIYVPVKNLYAVELADGATLSGEGVLKFNNLTVTLNNESHVNLNTLGKITIKPAEDCDFVYEKNETYKVFNGTF